MSEWQADLEARQSGENKLFSLFLSLYLFLSIYLFLSLYLFLCRKKLLERRCFNFDFVIIIFLESSNSAQGKGISFITANIIHFLKNTISFCSLFFGC